MAPQMNHDKSDSPVAPSSGGMRNFITHLSMDEGSVRDRARLLSKINDDGSEDESQSAFLLHFIKSSGPPQIITLCLLLALALGSTIGVVPAVVEDRYARLHHGYDGQPCLELTKEDRPHECLLGNEDAQNSAAMASFVSNSLTFATSSLLGSISDEKGRRGECRCTQYVLRIEKWFHLSCYVHFFAIIVSNRGLLCIGIMLLGIGLSIMAPLNLVLMQLFEGFDPFLYYASHALSGLVSWMAVALSALSDVMPPMWRAPSFGLVLAGFSMGFALSPILAVFLSHLGVSIFALIILLAGFIFACVSLPETLSPGAAEQARVKRLAERPTMNTRMDVWKYNLQRPMNELLILNRNKLFRLLSALAFFSGVVR